MEGLVMKENITKPTLYDRLGGVYSIAAVVDDLIERVMHNPVLNANAAVDEAHHRVSAAGFKYYVTEMVCWATGGPQNYTGRSMSESHKHLKITESEFAAFCKGFRRHHGEIQCAGGGAQGTVCHRAEHEG